MVLSWYGPLLLFLHFFILIDAFSADSPKPVMGRRKAVMYTFEEARNMARFQGHLSYDDFMAYDCPGAYQLPKNIPEIYPDEFVDWEDFLGIIYTYEEACARCSALNLKTEEEYRACYENGVDARLPALPDKKYKYKWTTWDDFLSQ